MHTKHTSNQSENVEKPDDWWYRIYAAVLITTVLVISALAAFTKHFS